MAADSSIIYLPFEFIDGKITISPVVGVEAIHELLPVKFELSQNYPNPFNPTTIINYQLPIANLVTLKVYDVLGREVATLVNEKKEAGRYEVEFNASNLSSGVFFYRLSASGRAGDFLSTKKFILIK
ncbi:MAG: T9SS type A sorting domain-containing protein [Ignavibacteriales bacterium]|nr:T9SS type A sorting domain-containing protein [Ignavibacteriales bacterium]